MSIDNPGGACYVGQAAATDVEPVTLQLAIPSNFAGSLLPANLRPAVGAGRRQAGDRSAVAAGRREFSFPTCRQCGAASVWQRPLDLPSAGVRVSVCSGQPGRVTPVQPRPGEGGRERSRSTRAGEPSPPDTCSASNWTICRRRDGLRSWGRSRAAGLICTTSLPLIRQRDGRGGAAIPAPAKPLLPQGERRRHEAIEAQRAGTAADGLGLLLAGLAAGCSAIRRSSANIPRPA